VKIFRPKNHRSRSSRLQTVLVEASPLRKFDPRLKMAIGICASLAVMLPLPRLLLFMLLYILVLAWARLLPAAARQIWRIKWVLLVLFALDTWLIGLDLAVVVCLRLVLLAGVFTLLVSTTTPGEFSLALEALRLPYRYSFSLGLAFQSLSLLDEEWRAIQEAQRSRGILSWDGTLPPLSAWREAIRQVASLAALTVPAVVLTTRRAWSITEAAYARGFDSPHRQPYRRLHLQAKDWAAFALTAIVMLALFLT
jgi:biotin transport system permease protein